MVKYKLTHFAVSSRADLCRLLFVTAGVDFEDNGLDKKDWHLHQPRAPFGSVTNLTKNQNSSQLLKDVDLSNFYFI
jgi:hypothetical protein